MPATNTPPQYCLLNWGRLNALRLNYTSTALYGSIGGVPLDPSTQAILIDSLSVSDRLNEEPNTLVATIRGTKPREGQAISLTYGSLNNLPLFAGTILRVTQVWAADNPKNILCHVEAVDPTWRLNEILVTARYRSQSASVTAADLVTRFAPAGYTTNIEPDLPALAEITFTNTKLMDALVQLANRIGGYAFCDYRSVVRVFAASTVVPPAPLTATHPSLANVQYTRDLTQIVTRAVVQGGGANALARVPPGFSDLPVEDLTWYSASGGRVVSGPQRVTYAGTQAGGAGSVVGPGVTPSSAPSVAGKTGAGVNAGTHQYAYTWTTTTGETPPSPVAAIVTGPIGPPVVAPAFVDYRYDVSLAPDPATGFVVGATVRYAVTYGTSYTVPTTGNGQPVSALGPPSAPITLIGISPGGTAGIAPMYVTGPTTADPIPSYMHFWVSVAGGPWYYGNNYTGNPNAGMVMVTGPNTGATAPPANGIGQVTVAGIAVGPTGTTARKVYRTAANATPLQLLQTIANNTTTSVVDAAGDATLGATAPGSDTSGLVQTVGQVNAGSTSLRVAGTGPFPPAGGWVLSGNNRIHYASVTATDLAGIPATGDGSIANTIPYGTPATMAPSLTGIPATGDGAIVWPILAGDPVDLLVIVDDVNAQATLKSLLGGSATGIREALIQDGRIGIKEALARGTALVKLQSTVLESLTHRSRDPNTVSGALVTVNLPPPTAISGTFRIQDVTVSTFHPRAGLFPNYDAHSSSSRYTLEDLLRQLSRTDPPPTTGETS